MNPTEHADNLPEEFARNLYEQRVRMQEAHGVIYYAHSRTGLLARFLQRMADKIDQPNGEARRIQR